MFFKRLMEKLDRLGEWTFLGFQAKMEAKIKLANDFSTAVQARAIELGIDKQTELANDLVATSSILIKQQGVNLKAVTDKNFSAAFGGIVDTEERQAAVKSEINAISEQLDYDPTVRSLGNHPR